MNQFKVFFELQGKGIDPDKISDFLNIAPTFIEKGQPGIHSTSHWVLSSGTQVGTVVDIGSEVERLIAKLEESEQKIIDISIKYQLKVYLEVEIKLAPHIFSVNSEKLDDVKITFQPDQLRFLSSVNAIVDIDIDYD